VQVLLQESQRVNGKLSAKTAPGIFVGYDGHELHISNSIVYVPSLRKCVVSKDVYDSTERIPVVSDPTVDLPSALVDLDVSKHNDVPQDRSVLPNIPNPSSRSFLGELPVPPVDSVSSSSSVSLPSSSSNTLLPVHSVSPV